MLLNLLNETSWPASGGSGLLGSVTPSAEVAFDVADESEAAVAEPSSAGGASAVDPGVAAVVDVVDEPDEAV